MLTVSIIFIRHLYEEKSRENHYIGLIELNIPKESEIIESNDSHGGLHGDDRGCRGALRFRQRLQDPKMGGCHTLPVFRGIYMVSYF